MNNSLNKKQDKITFITIVFIIVIMLVFFAILLPIMIEGGKQYYNKTIVVSEISIIDNVLGLRGTHDNNMLIIDTDGEGYILDRYFDAYIETGKMYDIQYYVINNKGPRIINKIKPDFFIVSYDCDIVGDVCK